MALPVFDIHPYVVALPLRFGTLRAEVPTVLGQPPRARDEADLFGPVRVAYYDTGTVVEIGFVPQGVTLRLAGQDLWDEKTILDPVPLLLAQDPDPLETVGFLVFLKLGVTVTGFHDGDKGQRALTVFRQGH